MGDVLCPSALWYRGGLNMLLLYWILTAVPPSLPQPPLPISLPAQMSLVPPPWRYLPLSQAELPLFSNSSPFSSSHSLLLLPPPGYAAKPALQASFGPHSVTQLVSDPVLPLSPLLSASLLSERVERERVEGGRVSYRVRVLFRQRGEASRGHCVALHAFRHTEEHKASCIMQPPLGLCVVTLTLPSDWFEADQLDQSDFGPNQRIRHAQHRGRHQRGRRYDNADGNSGTLFPSLRSHLGSEGAGEPEALMSQRGQTGDRVQLYYSSFGKVARCIEERLPQSQTELFFLHSVTLRDEEKKNERNRTKEEESCLNGHNDEELSLDSHVLIRYRRGPVQTGQPIGVSVSLRANFSADFVVIRIKVKKGLVSMVAQRTLTPDLWAVTLERTQGSKHDVIAIICHKHSLLKHTHSPSLLQQVACLSVDGLRRSFGVAMTVSANWWVEYSGHNKPASPLGAAVSSFSFTDRHISGIAPITESDTIINTAILTSEPVSLPVIVLAVGHDGKVSDVTAAVRCQSDNEDIVKVSSDCSTLFVDGSESGVGSTCVRVEFVLGVLSGSVCLAVWAPAVPLRISLSDPVLNAIDGWNHFTENGCTPVFQHSTVQVLTHFTAHNSQGQPTHLLGSSDWLVDVTELVRNWLRVENPRVASLDKHNNLIGLRPGKTALHVISSQWDGVLGSCDITVTSDPVTSGDLLVQVVSGLGMSIMASPTHPSVVTATVTAYNILYNHGQEASLSVWLGFSDDSSSLLSSFCDFPFSLRLSSLAESVVLVTTGPAQHVVAQGDGGGPLLRAELLVPNCSDTPITSNHIVVEGDEERRDNRDGGTRGRTMRLAKGSGWLRVNLDSDVPQPMGSEEDVEGEGFELVESDGDVYTNFHGDVGNVSVGYYYDIANGNAVGRTWNIDRRGGVDLERAVLTPNHEESAVYLSPSLEREEEEERREEGRWADREMEVGLGAVLSLLCLSSLLFLANCLPCTLRERRNRKPTGEEEEEEEEEWKKKEAEEQEE